MKPPVAARHVLALGLLARCSLWPLAFAGARGLSPAHPNATAFGLVLLTLLSSSVVSRARGAVAAVAATIGGLAAAAAMFGSSRVALAAMATPAAFPLALAVAATTGAVFAAVLFDERRRDERFLDERAVALLPVTVFLALAAIGTRVGAEALHAHVLFPSLSRALAGFSALTAVVAAVAWARQLRWNSRVYAGREAERVSPPIDEAAASMLPRLSHVTSDAVLAASVLDEPYRPSQSASLRLPHEPSRLFARHRRFGGLAALGVLCAAVALFASLGTVASSFDREGTLSTPKTLPPLPGRCADARPTIRLVPISPFAAIDVHEIAERYRSLGFGVEVDAPFALDALLVDPARKQVAGDALLRRVRLARPTRGPNEHLIALTDVDMYLREVAWRYAFATTEHGATIVSVARMRSSFDWGAPFGVSLERTECAPLLRARTYKMITRAILRGACAALPSADPRSARRASVLSLDDLDAIREDVF